MHRYFGIYFVCKLIWFNLQLDYKSLQYFINVYHIGKLYATYYARIKIGIWIHKVKKSHLNRFWSVTHLDCPDYTINNHAELATHSYGRYNQLHMQHEHHVAAAKHQQENHWQLKQRKCINIIAGFLIISCEEALRSGASRTAVVHGSGSSGESLTGVVHGSGSSGASRTGVVHGSGSSGASLTGVVHGSGSSGASRTGHSKLSSICIGKWDCGSAKAELALI